MSDSQKKRMGRPRTTVNDLPDDWEKIIMDCGQNGQSAVTIRCKLGIGESAWDTLLEDSEEFRRTIKDAKALCEHWWEERGREMALGSDGNATVWIFNMKNRFGWKDKTENVVTGANGAPLPAPIFNITGVAPKNDSD